MRPSVWRWTTTVLLGALLLILLAVRVGPDTISATLERVDPTFLLLGGLFYALFFVARGVRWKELLRHTAPAATVSDLASLSAAGWLVSTYVPFKMGDATRTALAARRNRTSVMAVAGTVAVERALDLVGLAVSSSAAMLLLAFSTHRSLPLFVREAVAVTWMLPILGVLGLLLLARLFPSTPDPPSWKRFLNRFSEAAEHLAKEPRRLPGILTLSSLVSFLQSAMFVFFVHAVTPDLPILVVAAGVPLFLLSFVISITPANIGTYEASFVAIYALLGLDGTGLLAAGVALHILTTVTVTVLGGVGFAYHSLSATDTRPMSPGAAEAPA